MFCDCGGGSFGYSRTSDDEEEEGLEMRQLQEEERVQLSQGTDASLGEPVANDVVAPHDDEGAVRGGLGQSLYTV